MLQSEELKRDLVIDPNSKHSIDVMGDFQFDSSAPPDLAVSQTMGGFGSGGVSDKLKARDAATKLKKEKRAAEKREKKGLPPLVAPKDKEEEREPFALRDIDLQIPKGTSCEDALLKLSVLMSDK